jgi:hypothetical protein
LVDEAAQEDSESVIRGRAWRFHGVATQPANEENCGYFAAGIVWSRDKGTQFFTALIGYPIVLNGGVLEVLAGLCGLRYN